MALSSDNCLVTMVDCGDGKAVPSRPRLLKYSIDGELVSTIDLNIPLNIDSKLRFMDIYGKHIFISDLGKYSPLLLYYIANINTIIFNL